MNIDNLILLFLSGCILYINDNRIIYEDLFNNSIIKIIILFFIIFNFNYKPKISLLLLIAFLLNLHYIYYNKIKLIKKIKNNNALN